MNHADRLKIRMGAAEVLFCTIVKHFAGYTLNTAADLTFGQMLMLVNYLAEMQRLEAAAMEDEPKPKPEPLKNPMKFNSLAEAAEYIKSKRGA